MKRDDLPPEVRLFLENAINSIEQLQVLLLLYIKPDRAWSISEIATELRSVDTSIEKRLNDIYQKQILEKYKDDEKLHKFLPASSTMRTLIENVAYQNQLRPYQVIDAIYSAPSKSIQDFADAFKVRGEKS